ncbi:MAG: Rhs family protein [Polyangiaceae bacterium]|nr:Rhs family protein [Polyangiaceae bacterium]
MWLDYASKDADPTSGVAHYLFTAPNGMPLRVENASGQVTWTSEAFDAYGNQAAGSTPPPIRLRFAGHFYDEDLGLFYNRFHGYDPTLARYLQPDPLGHEGGIIDASTAPRRRRRSHRSRIRESSPTSKRSGLRLRPKRPTHPGSRRKLPRPSRGKP